MSTKKMLGGFVVLVSLIGLGATALAANAPGGGGTTPAPTVMPGPITISANPCPSGWHLKPGTKSNDTYQCQPTKTARMIQCPPGLEYFDNGCNIGCDKPVY